MEMGDRVKMKERPFFTGTINGEQLVLAGLRKGRSFYLGWSFKPEGSLSQKVYSESVLEEVEEKGIIHGSKPND